jgi:hypothetical protein
LSKVVEELGGIFDLYPKYHPEMNYIEMYCSHASELIKQSFKKCGLDTDSSLKSEDCHRELLSGANLRVRLKIRDENPENAFNDEGEVFWWKTYSQGQDIDFRS